MCRRAHGAGYVTWLAVPRGQFSLDKGDEQLVRFRSSHHGTRSFCGRCGSTLFCETTHYPDMVDIVLANMNDPIDRARLQPDTSYSLQAMLTDTDGHAEFATDTRVPVNPASEKVVQFRVVRVPGK